MAQVTGQALREMCYWLEGGMGVGGEYKVAQPWSKAL